MQANDLLVDTLLSIPIILLMAFQSVSVENCRKYIIQSGYNYYSIHTYYIGKQTDF